MTKCEITDRAGHPAGRHAPLSLLRCGAAHRLLRPRAVANRTRPGPDAGAQRGLEPATSLHDPSRRKPEASSGGSPRLAIPDRSRGEPWLPTRELHVAGFENRCVASRRSRLPGVGGCKTRTSGYHPDAESQQS